MRKLKLVVVATVVVLFLGISNVSAQGKSTVMIKIVVSPALKLPYKITTILPNYTKYDLEGESKNDNAYIALKKELDKWVKEGYSIINTGSPMYYNGTNEVVYFLVKEE